MKTKTVYTNLFSTLANNSLQPLTVTPQEEFYTRDSTCMTICHIQSAHMHTNTEYRNYALFINYATYEGIKILNSNSFHKGPKYTTKIMPHIISKMQRHKEECKCRWNNDERWQVDNNNILVFGNSGQVAALSYKETMRRRIGEGRGKISEWSTSDGRPTKWRKVWEGESWTLKSAVTSWWLHTLNDHNM